MEQPVTPRRTQRKQISLAAQCRTATGIRDDGYLSDLSAEGCCITTRGILFLVGSRVLIKPKGLEGLSGVVRWINGHKAGVQFDSPLYGPVVDHLSQMYGAGQPVDVSRHN